MRVTAESTANLGTTKVKNVCFIITYSQCDISHLSRAEFADIIVDAWVALSGREFRWLVERAVVTSTRQTNCPQDRGGELSECSRIVNISLNTVFL